MIKVNNNFQINFVDYSWSDHRNSVIIQKIRNIQLREAHKKFTGDPTLVNNVVLIFINIDTPRCAICRVLK